MSEPKLLVVRLAYGSADQVIGSCAYSHAIQQRLALKHAPAATLLDYPDAGHTLNSFGAYIPVGDTIHSIGDITETADGTLLHDAEARDDGWNQLIHWLAQLPP